jgi:hypothetical protein
MELYSLDSNFARVDLIEDFKSAIWTERYSVHGDFEITFDSKDFGKLASIDEGGFISLRGSQHVGIIEKQEFRDGLVKTSGPFLEAFLKHRVYTFIGNIPGGTKTLKRKDVPERVCAWILYWYLGAGLASAPQVLALEGAQYDAFDNLDVGFNNESGDQSDYIYPSTPIVEVSLTAPDSMYNLIVSVLQPNGIGWRLYPVNPGDGYELHWRGYRGLDRSKDQSVNSVVMFSESLDSLSSSEEIHTMEDYYTAIHINAPEMQPWFVSNGMDPEDYVGFATAPGTSSYTKFQRRTLLLEATDITPNEYGSWTSPTVNGGVEAKKVLDQRAKDELANRALKRMFNGEIGTSPQFKYGTDYNMGDIVTLQGAHGTHQNARIVEYIRSLDGGISKEYPTIMVTD